MEAILHIEPIVRNTPAPLSVGHSDYIFYGERLTADDENIGMCSSNLSLGCPLESLDQGNHMSHVPLVKTIDYMPDLSCRDGHVYAETLHYLKNKHELIPYRSKLRTGLGQGIRFTHIPGLNAIRESLTGTSLRVCDPRSDIIEDVLLRDKSFEKHGNSALRDWVEDELIGSLSHKTTTEFSFSTGPLRNMTHRYIAKIHQTPSEITTRHLKDILSIVSPESNYTPIQYLTDVPISKSLLDFRNRLIPHQLNFRSFGQIPIEKINRIQRNPFEFQDICELLDCIPLSDFNVDIVVTHDCDVVFYHEHVALDRLGAVEENETGLYSTEYLLKDYLTGEVLNDILKKFMFHHNDLTEEIEELIDYHAVKMKIIKTSTDEAAILLYNANGTSEDKALCGVYFDIALQSLSPMSIMREPIMN